MFNRFLLLFIFSIVVSSCSLLDRGSKEDVVELETIPEETIQEPSILIDDEEMMPADDTTIVDDGAVSRSAQIEAGASGTFAGQKIDPLREDFIAVMEAFNIHRDSY